MTKTYFKLNTGAILSSDIWLDATGDELKVLAYIVAKGEGEFSPEGIAEACKISKARAVSAIGLWREAGVLTEIEGAKEARGADTVEYEFKKRISEDEFCDMTPLEVAGEIRSGNLRAVMEEIAELVGKPVLNEGEVRIVTALYSDLGLSTEYIRTLSLYLSENTQKFTVYKLKREAVKLADNSITETELLEKYIADTTAKNEDEREFKSVFGGDIWKRNLTPSEKKYCRRWWGEFGFSAAIVDMARDIAIQNTGEAKLSYMDKCLTAWHEAGCTTVEAVIAHREAEAAARAAAPKPKGGKPKGGKTAEVPTYGDFNSDDALMRALERSYGTDKS